MNIILNNETAFNICKYYLPIMNVVAFFLINILKIQLTMHTYLPQYHPKKHRKHTEKTPTTTKNRAYARKKSPKKAFALTREKIIICLAKLRSAKNVGISPLESELDL